MTSTPTSGNATQPLQRDMSRKAIAGVASGISRHLGLSLSLCRGAFVLLVLFNGLGALLYGAMWVLMPPGDRGDEAPGLAGAARAGMRPQLRVSPTNPGVLFSVGALIAGVLWFLVFDADTGSDSRMSIFWPLLIGGLGVVVVWVQADGFGSAASDASRPRSRGKVVASIARLIGGLLLVGFGISWILAAQVGLDGFPTVLGAAIALLAGVLVVAAPWMLRVWARVKTAERERMRAEARADMAAHLHDSVLQTLALIQRQAGDPAAVASLARRQERELRTWLYGEEAKAQTLRGALEQLRVDVEERFPVAVEVICVGDLDLDEATTALIQATGEAVTNAAKHSGASRVDVYAEVDPEHIEVFVRDRGCGFDQAAIRADRRGVRESILARMERHRGTARIRTSPGEGTEVRLELRR